ncbi:MAG TPA: archaetidylserine decarboxylase [Usitatibacter sp.]|nr:archaetidylserine decarboxylase [Usitatibacter sp.]
MTARELISRVVLQEDLNFLLTNRIPRLWATRFMGWFSRIEQPWVRDASIAVWKLFAALELDDARQTLFRSLHDCFTRELKEGARPIDAAPGILVSPCDGIVGACGSVEGVSVIQAKGFPYTLDDLVGDRAWADRYRDGCYVTLRITSSMYHRFHAPEAGTVQRVNYISGDTWNVNPIALARVERLFCKNERAAIEMELADGTPVTMVAVAAILVAGIRLHFADVLLNLRYRGVNRLACAALAERGEELGWFEHGSTIIVLGPKGFSLAPGIEPGRRVRMGEALVRVTQGASVAHAA